MDIKQMLKNHIAEMEGEVERLQWEIDEMRTRKETIQREAIKLKTKLAAIPEDTEKGA